MAQEGVTVMSENDPASLAQRLAEWDDRQAITDLLYRHAEHIRSGTIHLAHDLFMPDATFDLSHFDPERPGHLILLDRTAGGAQITEAKDAFAGSAARLWPMIHNVRVELDGDRATSVCVSHTVIWPHGKDFVGEYRDSLKRDGGVWRFAARNFILFGDTDGKFATQSHEEYLAMRR